MKNKIKKIIIILLLIILLIILSIIIIAKNALNEEKEILSSIDEGEPGDEITDYSMTEIEVLSDKTEYYTVQNCINEYLNIINSTNSIYYIEDTYDEEIQKEYIYNLLDKEYISSMNITESNVLENIKLIEQKEIFIPLKINVLEKSNINKYVAYGIVQTLDNQFIEELYIYINLDIPNKTYSVEPIKEEYNDIDEIKIINNNNSIEDNTYNTYENQNVTYEYIARQFLLKYKRLSLSIPEKAYELMNDEYKEKRFGSLENFEYYINENKDKISVTNISKYLVNNYDEYNEYIVEDQYGNYYIFTDYEENQKLEIKLDTYTIATENFTETYNSASDEEKAQMNIDKFFQMINRSDYRTSYNCLSEEFKNNYFDTEDKFKEYVKSAFFEYNEVEYEEYTALGGNIYVYDLKLTDLTGSSSEEKEISIIVKIKDDLEFELSISLE